MKRFAFLVLALSLAAPSWAAPVVPATPQDTVINSESMELVGTDSETVTTFTGHVTVTGTDMLMTCDYLKVTAFRRGDPKATIGKYGAFKALVATGHVKIVQADRVATCGHAEVLPGEDRVVLTDHPAVKDATDQTAITGYRMTLYRNQRRALVESDPNEKVIVTMPTIKDLGFDTTGTDASPQGKSK